jgi:hypothetical protein
MGRTVGRAAISPMLRPLFGLRILEGNPSIRPENDGRLMVTAVAQRDGHLT